MSTMFEQRIQALDADSASVAASFGGETRVAEHSRRGTPGWESRLLEAERFMQDIRVGRRGVHHFVEAMSTSDFPLLFADSLDRQLYGAYEATQPTWQNYARAATVNDFREVKRFATSGVRGLLTRVGELAEHPRRAADMAEYKYSVNKYEAGFALSFETMINDDLGAFLRLPQDLAASARDSEEEFVTRLFAGPTGPRADVYKTANDNVLAGNPALTRDALQAAITKLMKRKDERGNPIQVTSVELVVGTGLSLAASEIINATEYRAAGPNGDVTIIKGNGVGGNLRISTNYFIDSVVSSANADTSWWLFANPNGPRPALEFGRLRGYEQPALYEKIPDMRRLGGAEVPWSFNHGASEKKVQHIYGGSFVDPRMTVASNGSGS
ncbi:phage major capsid protein [Melissospora conviva]|uniref:phage major capsid protein n=1 Tax=Melissospora conviva TaxID=3388432 RepID=UPI003C205D4F